jgi:glycine cleavage system aminomethyltransferase T
MKLIFRDHFNGFCVRLKKPDFIGKDIGLVCLPPELAKAGIALEVEILGERVKALVADLPLVDPKGEKIRA